MRSGKNSWLIGGLAAVSVLAVGVFAQAPGGRQGRGQGQGQGQGQGRTFAQWDKIEISVTDKLAPNLYVLQGSPEYDTSHPDAAGGRVAVLFGPDGILMVDSQDEELGEKVYKTIRTFSQAPIRILVNSHIHPDHTGGNAFFAKQGALIFARAELREEMLRPSRGNPAGPDPAAVPVVTYGLDAPVTVRMNGEVVDFLPVPASHTGGDTMIRFEHANAIYIGDFYRNFGYPFADLNNGGSVKGMLTALDLIYKTAAPDTTLVPGHGTLVKRDDLLPYRDMIVDIRAKVQGLINQGKTLEEVLAANLTASYDAKTKGDTPQSISRFITEVYQEEKGGQ
jgi:cyclase